MSEINSKAHVYIATILKDESVDMDFESCNEAMRDMDIFVVQKSRLKTEKPR